MEEIGSQNARSHFFSLLGKQLFLEALLFQRKNNFKKINKIILIFFRKRWFLWHTKTITVYLLGNFFFQFLNVLIRSFFCYFFYFFYYRSICIIHNGASRRQTRNACFPARCADHFTTIYKCYI